MKPTPISTIIQLLGLTAVMEQRFSAGLGAIHGLALKEVLFLLHVRHAPGGRISRADLAKRLHLSPSTVTRMAAPLEKLGVIAREPDARDARLVYVALTPAGEELLGNAHVSLEGMAERFVRDRWSAADIDILDELLGRMTAGLPGDLKGLA